ncbi:MAG: N-succinylarginine dihydrolase, partial [Candidatus Sumerlaeota bacterium]|nr:N-succinylarginine dihydrolase [Candidatus Sumerlaeota bacterium]
MTAPAFEINFDGLVGPTHNYGGLSYGNLASQHWGGTVSHPRQAALQGLEKMKLLADLGLRQAVLPPRERPDLRALRRVGFEGSNAQVIEKAFKASPILLAACYSASCMWAANAATVSPSADCADGRVHFAPANLVSQFHRSLEPPTTAAVLRAIFGDEKRFAHHPPLPAARHFSDEGAANHTRLCATYGDPGIEVFAYGAKAFDAFPAPMRAPARQTLEASEAVARLHGLEPARTVFARQNSEAIEAGVFHNDVISVGNQNVFLCHALAFADGAAARDEIRRKWEALAAGELIWIEIAPEELSLAEAVATYFFNSQIVTLPDGSMCLIAPAECEESPRAGAVIQRILAEDNPIRSARFVDIRQSMKNGGGPACLRLRVVLTEEELACVKRSVFLTDSLYADLTAWVKRFYREDLRPEDLADPSLMEESRAALDALKRILDLRDDS